MHLETRPLLQTLHLSRCSPLLVREGRWSPVGTLLLREDVQGPCPEAAAGLRPRLGARWPAGAPSPPCFGLLPNHTAPTTSADLRALRLVFIFMKEAAMNSVPLQSVCLLHVSYIGPFLSVSRPQVTHRQHPRDVYKRLLRARHCRGSWSLSPGSWSSWWRR